MVLSKTEINLRRLLAAAPQQENSIKLIHYVATLRDQLAQLTGENTPDGLSCISASKAKEYADRIDALAEKIDAAAIKNDSDSLDQQLEPFKLPNAMNSNPMLAGKEKEGTDRAPVATVLRKRNISKIQPDSNAVNASTKESSIKLDTATHSHIEKHRRLQEDLTDEMVGLAQQLKETSRAMNKSVLESEKILDSTQSAIESSLASTSVVNAKAGEVYSQSSKTSCFTLLILFLMTCMFLFVVMLIRIT